MTLEDEEFKVLWVSFLKETSNLTNVVINKKYEINMYYEEKIKRFEGDDNSDPWYWHLQFLSPTKLTISRYFKMGRVHTVEFSANYNLENNQFLFDYVDEQQIGMDKNSMAIYSTLEIKIKNDIVIKKRKY